MKKNILLILVLLILVQACTLESLHQNIVNNPPDDTSPEPVACFEIQSVTNDTIAPAQIQFDAFCSENATSFQWDFDGGESDDNASSSPLVTFKTGGSYNIRLVVKGVDSKQDDTTVLVQIKTPIAVSFTHTIDCLTASFTNTSNQNGVNFIWDFGDGQFSNEINPTHTYEMGGDYTVKLTAEKDNLSGSFQQTIPIALSSFSKQIGDGGDHEDGLGVIQNANGKFLVIGHRSDNFIGLELDPCGTPSPIQPLISENNLAPGRMIHLSNGQLLVAGFNNGGENGFLFTLNEDLSAPLIQNFPSPIVGTKTYWNTPIELNNGDIAVVGKKFGDGEWGTSLFRKNISDPSSTAISKIYSINQIGGNPNLIEGDDNGFILISTGTFGASLISLRYTKVDASFENPQGSNIRTPTIEHAYMSARAHKISGGDILIYGNTRVEADTWIPYLVKITNNGSVFFAKEYPESQVSNVKAHAEVLRALELEDGYLLAGRHSLFNDSRHFLIKTDFNGNVIWNKSYGLSESELSDVIQTSDGGFLIVGRNEGAVDRQIDIVKTDAEGNVN